MKKGILFILLLISSYTLHAQIDIGSSADELLYFLELQYQDTKKRDPFDTKGLKFEYEVKRERGVITDVMVYQKNQIFIDLQAKSNTVTDYEILDNEITGILTSYESLTVEHIEERFDKIYGDYKVEGFYFTEDFRYVRNIFWHNNVASIHYTEALPSYLGNETYGAIREKQLEYEEKY